MWRFGLPAVPGALALVLGSFCGRHSAWCPPGLCVLLLALGLAVRGGWGRVSAFLAIGLIVGLMSVDPQVTPDTSRPVEIGWSTRRPWQNGAHGPWVGGHSNWIRQGRRVERWSEELNLLLSPGMAPPESSRLRLRGFLRRPAPLANGGDTKPGKWSLRIKSGVFMAEEAGAPGIFRSQIDRISRFLRDRIDRGLIEAERSGFARGASLVRVLVLGEQDGLPPAVKRGMRAAGLAHLVALSGLHVGLLVGIGLWCASPFGMRVKFAVAISLALLYVWLAGARPSLIRATLMVIALMCSWFLRRPPQPVNILCWVAAGMVAVQPSLIEQLSFQLTVAATGGILLLSPHLEGRWSWLPEHFRKPLSVSVAAYVAVVPWSWSQFCLATLLSPFWNLLAVPWATVALSLAFLWILFQWILPAAGDLMSAVLNLVAAPIEIFALLPPEVLGSVPIRLEGWVAVVMAGALVATVSGSGGLRLLGLTMAIVTLAWSVPSADEAPQLVLLDVGQGEAILIRDGTEAFLIDGGGWRRGDLAGRVLVPALARLGVHRLKGMILSHPDIDHCEGLLGLTSYMSVDKLFLSPGWRGDRCVDELLGVSGIEGHPLWRGEQLTLGRWLLRVVHPAPGEREGRNNRSLALLAETRGQTVLLTGDLEAGGERQIMSLRTKWINDIDILKVGHHGSNTSTTAAWLDRIQPRIALISCGQGNSYGHPSPDVLRRLAGHHVRVLRTDLEGMIKISFGPGKTTHLSFPGQP